MQILIARLLSLFTRPSLSRRVAQLEYGQQVHTGLLAAHLERHAAKHALAASRPAADRRFADTVPINPTRCTRHESRIHE